MEVLAVKPKALPESYFTSSHCCVPQPRNPFLSTLIYVTLEGSPNTLIIPLIEWVEERQFSKLVSGKLFCVKKTVLQVTSNISARLSLGTLTAGSFSYPVPYFLHSTGTF